MNRNFILLWQGQSVSQIGNQVAMVVVLFWLKQNTGSATIVGLMMMASVFPSIILGPIAGTFADYYPRQKIIVYSDIISGLVILSVTGIIFLVPDSVNIVIIALLIGCSLVSLVSSFLRPAISASIPDIVPRSQVAQANSLNEASAQIATFIGYGLGGVLFQLLGTPLLLLINGLTYIASAISESFIQIPQIISPSSMGWKQAFRNFQFEIVKGLHYVWHKPGMKELFLAAASLNFWAVPIFTLLPFYVEDFLHKGADWYGFLMSAFGMGMLIGFVSINLIRIPVKVKSALIVSLAMGASLSLAGLGLVKIPIVALMLMFSIGIMMGLVSVLGITILQVTTPSQMRGRVFGFLNTLSQALSPIAMGLSGLVADWTCQNIPLIYVICGGISLLVAIRLSMKEEFHEFLTSDI